jgi:hypothetical protein
MRKNSVREIREALMMSKLIPKQNEKSSRRNWRLARLAMKG